MLRERSECGSTVTFSKKFSFQHRAIVCLSFKIISFFAFGRSLGKSPGFYLNFSLTLPVRIPDEEKKLTLIFIFTLFCGASIWDTTKKWKQKFKLIFLQGAERFNLLLGIWAWSSHEVTKQTFYKYCHKARILKDFQPLFFCVQCPTWLSARKRRTQRINRMSDTEKYGYVYLQEIVGCLH